MRGEGWEMVLRTLSWVTKTVVKKKRWVGKEKIEVGSGVCVPERRV